MEFKYNAIKEIILKTLKNTGTCSTPIKGVSFARRDEPSNFLKCFYNPTCILVLQGQKQMFYGEYNYTYGKGQYVVSCADIPVTSKVSAASVEEPFLALVLEFDSNLISDIILETGGGFAQNINPAKEKCIGTAEVEEPLLDAFYRLIQLIEKPKAELEIMAPIIIKEIYYRLLVGPLGGQLRLINTKGTRSNQIVKAIQYLKNKYSEKLNIEEIAQYVNMAPSSFYRNFKKVTQISPLQYQKQLRLYEAKRLMLTGEHNAESASYTVGYESPTQFSREYKKMFGNPPRADVKTPAV